MKIAVDSQQPVKRAAAVETRRSFARSRGLEFENTAALGLTPQSRHIGISPASQAKNDDQEV